MQNSVVKLSAHVRTRPAFSRPFASHRHRTTSLAHVDPKPKASSVFGLRMRASGCELELGRRLKAGDTIELVIESTGTLFDRVVGSGARQ